ncbi:hypothetical protein [Methanolobus chelungpuianus]|uniref:Uncharacterized protein n=1 Tax=Methanolobus chelungpuianus TaxID=502115 RepID=A0AAE3HAL4_9EURY|nr:hypothetical protein [Methanolobus chelungpuianus]MCQ6962609.1 hypothetical protein [Methanolobus chelungpuianus]
MEKGRFPVVLTGVLALLILAGGIYAGAVHLKADSRELNVNSTRAVSLVQDDPAAAAYMSDNFRVSGWRATKTTLIEGAELAGNIPANLSASTADDTRVWKVEIMERTCACPAPNNLYVVEGYVDASTGEVLHVRTMKAPEKNYERETCASTACH